MERMHLQISGMSCGHCVASVTRALQSVDGVTPRTVQVGAAEIDFDPTRTHPAAIIAAVSDEGFPAQRVNDPIALPGGGT